MITIYYKNPSTGVITQNSVPQGDYDTYWSQQGWTAQAPGATAPTTPAASSSGSSNIPFKSGLTQAQQQSISDLVANKDVSQWTTTDKQNWSYATNGSALPSAGSTQTSTPPAPSSGTSATPPAPSSGTGASSAPTPSSDAPVSFSRSGVLENPNNGDRVTVFDSGQMAQYTAQGYRVVIAPGAPVSSTSSSASTPSTPSTGTQAFVNDLYQKYFDRNATDAEMQNWAKETPQTLESFLQAEQVRYGYTSKAQLAANSQNATDALAMIDADTNLSPEMKALFKQVVQSYNGGIEANSKDILDTFNTIKSTTIDPYYAGLAGLAAKQLIDQVSSLQTQRSQELETQGTAATQAVTDEQKALEAKGMTFTGEGVKQLGAGSATDPAKFGGGPIPEGLIPQSNRLIASSSALRYQDALNTLGANTEATSGSAAASAVPGYTPAGGVLGTTPKAQQAEEASALTSVMNNEMSSRALQLNTPFTLKV